MKHKASAAVMAAVMALSLMTGCGNKNGGTSSSQAVTSEQSAETSSDSVINSEEVNDAFKDVPDFEGEGPQIYLSNTTAKAGELAEVTLSVKNADMQWSMCGIHVIYPEVLQPDMVSKEERTVRYTKGSAIEEASGSVCMEWQNGLPDILKEKKQGCLFFTAMFSGNGGFDGDIATFYLKVPDNAQPGAVYNLGYFYLNTDLFINTENNQSFQKYAFTNMQGGTITVV